jgi:hypothetical protein
MFEARQASPAFRAGALVLSTKPRLTPRLRPSGSFPARVRSGRRPSSDAAEDVSSSVEHASRGVIALSSRPTDARARPVFDKALKDESDDSGQAEYDCCASRASESEALQACSDTYVQRGQTSRP